MVSSSFVFLVISLISLGTSDIACVTAGQPGCSSPYPPGHHFMGPSWYAIGRETFNTTILSMSTTLYLSEAPTNITGTLAVNAALENTNISNWLDTAPYPITFQNVIAAYPSEHCGQRPGQWCAFTGGYNEWQNPQETITPPFAVSSGNFSQNATYGDYLILKYGVSPNPRPNIMYDVGINASVGGTGVAEVLSETVPSNSSALYKAPWQVWLKTECGCQSQGMIPKHTYYGTTIVLDKQVPDFGNSSWSVAASASIPQTSDGGKTWSITSIDIESSYCSNLNSCG